MTKTELISAMAAECSLSKTDAGKALDAFMHQVTVALSSGEKVILTGFGVFEVKERAERSEPADQGGDPHPCVPHPQLQARQASEGGYEGLMPLWREE